MSSPGGLDFVFAVLRANEGLIVALALAAGCLFVLLLFTLILGGAGASRRPVVFLAGLFLPIVITLLIGQLVAARWPTQDSGPLPGLSADHGRLSARMELFGPDVPPEFIRDARGMLPGVLDGAEIAEAAVTPEGCTILVAQFADDDAARRAAAAYHHAFGLRDTGGDEDSGWTARRSAGDYIEMLRAGRILFVWSGPTPEAASARRAISNLGTALPPGARREAAPLFPALQPLAEAFSTTSAKVSGLLLLAGIYVAWFFKGASWAGRVEPAPHSVAVAADELESRLLALNGEGFPFTIVKGDRHGELVADWRYADATFLDLARARGLRRTFRIRMVLDARRQAVRATDYTAECDWSAGLSGGEMAWRVATGIVFFQRQQEVVLGVRVDEAGRRAGGLWHSFSFDLATMRAPLIRVVSQSGWTWRPALIAVRGRSRRHA